MFNIIFPRGRRPLETKKQTEGPETEAAPTSPDDIRGGIEAKSKSKATDRSVRPTRFVANADSRFLTGLGARFGMTSLLGTGLTSAG